MPAFSFPLPRASVLPRDESGRLSELEGYVYQLVDYLRFILSELDEENMNASAADNLSDTGWKPLTVTASSLSTGKDSARIRRTGALAYLYGSLSVTSTTAAIKGTEPLWFSAVSKGFRPQQRICRICSDSAGHTFVLTVKPDGQVGISAFSGTVTVGLEIPFTISYRID